MSNPIHCIECNRNMQLGAKGMCKKCYDREYYQLNKEKRILQIKEYRENNLIWHKEYHRQYRAEHAEERRLYQKRYYKENKERILNRHKEFYKQNRERLLLQCKNWAKRNPDKVREGFRRYRSRKQRATIFPVNERFVYERDGNMCIYCGSRKKLTLDHVVALACGGSHCEENLVVACASCNSKKHTKPLLDWVLTQSWSMAWLF